MTRTAAEMFATEGFDSHNLPYGSFSIDGGETFHLGVRLGNRVLELGGLAGCIRGLSEEGVKAVSAPNLDSLLAAGASVWRPIRSWLQKVVTDPEYTDTVAAHSYAIDQATFQLAFSPADYVDYYASEHHATNLGKMFRPDEAALKPNWKHLPVGYHGRSGTIIVSGTDIIRPKGLRPEPGGVPSFGPSRRLDIEAEIGFVLGGSAPTGEVSVASAAQNHIFGVFLFNDWSARDIQNFEYVPLGPYLGKSFASTVGTWIIPWDALSSARVNAPDRTVNIAEYLQDGSEQDGPYALDITMGVVVDGKTISNPPYKLMYWTAPQMVAHMTVNGAALRPGDMFASGTVSGTKRNQWGSFIELSWGGTEPIELKDGAKMLFLEDGQIVELTGSAPGPDGTLIDFGECLGTIRSATEGSHR